MAKLKTQFLVTGTNQETVLIYPDGGWVMVEKPVDEKRMVFHRNDVPKIIEALQKSLELPID